MSLRATDLTVIRAGRRVLDAVSVDIAAGEVVGLIGPNGAGKTTLLRALCGLDPPQSGQVSIQGRPLSALSRVETGRAVAYLAQGGRIHWPMRVDELVALGRLPHRAAPDADDPAVERALKAADVWRLRARITGSLSGGERARVLLARALAVDAPFLLADEPVAALDPYHQLQVMDVMRASARAGAGVVVVLHDLTLAARFCDRLVLLREARKLADGAPVEVLTSERLGLAYGVSIARGTHEGEAFVLPWRRLPGGAEPGEGA